MMSREKNLKKGGKTVSKKNLKREAHQQLGLRATNKSPKVGEDAGTRPPSLDGAHGGTLLPQWNMHGAAQEDQSPTASL
jgi:hypothetical protein